MEMVTQTVAGTAEGRSKAFEVKVEQHQRHVLSPNWNQAVWSPRKVDYDGLDVNMKSTGSNPV